MTSVRLGLALGCLVVLVPRARALPAPLAWFTLVVAGVNVVATPAVIAGAKIADPLTLVESLIWALTIAVTLRIKPVWALKQPNVGALAAW